MLFMGAVPKSAKRVFNGIMFDVYQWEQKQFDGSYSTFEKATRLYSVNVIAVLNGKIIVTKETQPGIKSHYWLPGGRCDRGEKPLSAAKRELFEETGLKSKDWELLGFDDMNPWHIDWKGYWFVARECAGKLKGQNDSSEKVVPVAVNFDRFIEIANKLFSGNPRFILDGAVQSRAARAALRKRILG